MNIENMYRITVLLVVGMLFVSCDKKKKEVVETADPILKGVEVVGQALTIDHLLRFCSDEKFDVIGPDTYPQPNKPSERLTQFVKDHYKRGYEIVDKKTKEVVEVISVKNIITKYYLDYDFACLKDRHHFKYVNPNKNLVSFFIATELGNDKKFAESPSLELIRYYVKQQQKMLQLDDQGQKKWHRNDTKYREYLAFSTR